MTSERIHKTDSGVNGEPVSFAWFFISIPYAYQVCDNFLLHVPLPSGGETHKEFVGYRNDFLNEDLLVVSLSKRACREIINAMWRCVYTGSPLVYIEDGRLTYVVAGGVAAVALGLLQRDDLEGSQWCGSRLSGDHASKASHCPCPDMVIVGTHCNTQNHTAVSFPPVHNLPVSFIQETTFY